MAFKRSFLVSFALFLALASSFFAGFVTRDRFFRSADQLPVLQQAYQLLLDYGLKEAPPEKSLEYGMIRGMVQAYDDPYTVFIEPVQTELESNTLHGSFGGIGVRLGTDEAGYILLYPYPGSPAAEAGILEGARLIAVDGEAVAAGTPFEDVQAAIRGPVGKKVRLTIQNPSAAEEQEVSVQRSEIPIPSVTWHLDPDESQVGVVEINTIATSTPDEIQKAFTDLQGRGATHFILDLRNNGGGMLIAGVDIARLFLKDGIVIQQQYRDQEVKTYSVEKPGPLSDQPLAILVNQNTASAAEIVAGSLQARGRARLIGSTTYGKNAIQSVYPLLDGSSLHVTTASWWVPGSNLPKMGAGLQPDISLSQESANSDEAVREAVRVLLQE